MAKKTDAKEPENAAETKAPADSAKPAETKTDAASSKPAETKAAEKPAEAKPAEAAKEPEKAAEATKPEVAPTATDAKANTGSPPQEAKPAAPATTPEAPAEKKAVSLTQEAPPAEKPKRGIKLPFLGKKKAAAVVTDASGKPVSPQEAINELDPAVKVRSESQEQALAAEIDKQIKESSQGEVLTVKVNKQKFLLMLGIIVLLMWIIPIIKGMEAVVSNFRTQPSPTPEATATPQPSATPYVTRIRLRNTSGKIEVAQGLSDLLKSNGFELDVLHEATGSAKVNSIAVKAGQAGLGEKLVTLLNENKYLVATYSGDLDEESSFDAVIGFVK